MITTDTAHNSSIDAGQGWVNEPADLLTQILADDINEQVTTSIRRECQAQNNNETADWYTSRW